MTRKLALAALIVATQAGASGFYFGDNGTKALLQGGAFTAQADDLSAIQHNPAGLAQLDGIHFLADLQVLNHSVSFQRLDPGFDPAALSPAEDARCASGTATNLVCQVQNSGGAFLLPFIGGSYSLPLGERTLSLALGVLAPPSVGRYTFPTPNYEKDSAGKYVENPRKYAPSRYTLVNNDILILYPSLTAAVDVLPKKLMVGASLQVVVSQFMFRQGLYSGFSTPARLFDESPEFDSLVRVDLGGRIGITGILGALYKPTEALSFGVSVRPPVPIVARGSMDVTLGENAERANTVVTGEKTVPCAVDKNRQCPIAELTMTLPLELKVGARWKPIPRLGLNLDFVLQGWNSIDKLVLTPQTVSMTLGGQEPLLLESVVIPKQWKMTYSARLGGSFEVLPDRLSAHAGVWYETAASPDAYYTIDFAHPDRLFVTGGLSVKVSSLELVGGVAFTPATTTNVVQSEVRQGQTDATIAGGVVGAGVYTSGGWSGTIGIRGHFGKKVERAAAPAAPTPAAPPQAEPTPEPAAAPATN